MNSLVGERPEATIAASDEVPADIQPGGWAGIVEALVLLALAAAAWLLTRGFAEGELMVAYGIDPAVVPRAVILIVVVLTVLSLIGEKIQPLGWPQPRLHPRVGAVAFAWASLTLYVVTFEMLGAFTLMPLFCAAVSRAFVRRPLGSLLLYGVAVSAFTWVLFVLLLRAPLPGPRIPFL